jgi:anti-sigma regulatory factor (Ser/Thr protein kinase)
VAGAAGTTDGAAWSRRPTPARGFRHEALFYAGGVDGFVRETAPFIDGALSAQAPVLVAVAQPRVAALEQRLGADARRVRFADIRRLGSNPARIMSIWSDFSAAASNTTGALGIGEPVWAERSAAELQECERHEMLVNCAFDDGGGWRLLCPYDIDALDDGVIEAAHRSHPHIARGGASHDNDAYARAGAPTDTLAGTLPAPTGAVQEVAFTAADLGAIRRLIERWATAEQLHPERTHELVLAVNELTSNSVSYGGGGGTLRLWRDGNTLICDVSDDGQVQDPLAGRVRPGPHDTSGRGLWLANQLCDLVQIRSGAAGTVVRVHKRRS